MSQLYVLKANGDKELFAEDKIMQSLVASRVPLKKLELILSEIKKRLYQNIPTKEIAALVDKYLTEIDPVGKVRYQLKKAVMNLGPTGYPFELYVSEILKNYGYKTEVNQLLRGRCVTHEVDVVAQKEHRTYFIECKYHNQPGMRSDLKVVLYVYARGLDLREQYKDEKDNYQSWVFTNTKFSEEALSYGACQGMRLTGWDYPQGESLQNMVEKKKLYPLTVLTSLHDIQKKYLMEKGIVLVKQLEDIPHLKTLLDLSEEGLEKVKRECLLLED